MAMPAKDEPVEYLGAVWNFTGAVWNFTGDKNLNGNYWIERKDDKGSHGAYVPIASIKRINPYVTVTLLADELRQIITAAEVHRLNPEVTKRLRNALENAKTPREDYVEVRNKEKDGQ